MHDRVAGTLSIHQKAYIDMLLETYNMTDCSPCWTPAAPGTKLQKANPDDDIDLSFPFRELVGSLLWVAGCSRPDILYAVNQLGAHCNAPLTAHVTAAKRVLRYLKGTSELKLVLRRAGKLVLGAYSDSDFAAEPEGNDTPMRSISGGIIYLHGVGPLHCQSSLQPTIARSTAEAETRCAASIAAKVSAFRFALEQFGQKQDGPTVVFEDNQACIASTSHFMSGCQTRHVKMDHAFVRQEILAESIQLVYCETAHMIADMFTKAQPKELFIEQRDILLGKL